MPSNQVVSRGRVGSARSRTGESPRRRKLWRGQLGLVAACAAVLLPCYFLVLGAFKSVPEFFDSPFGLPKSWALDNFYDAWESANLAVAFRNSVLVTSAAVLLSTACSALGAYAIARIPFRGPKLVQMVFVAGMVLPTQLIVVAAFVEMRWLGIIGTIWPVIILYAVYGLPLGILFLTAFFRAVPTEFTDAAAIDGAGRWRQFAQIVLPLSKAPILTVAVINSVWIWNDFFVPLVFANRSDLETVPLAILNFYGASTTDYGLVFAGVIMSTLPVVVVYVFMTRQFIGSVMAGGIKG